MLNNSIDQEAHCKRLQKRRDEVILTLEHVRGELRAVDDNKDWIDLASYKDRVALLESLTDWYVNESTAIDNALNRITEGKYGLCLACKGPIEAPRLETAPATAFCAECQGLREVIG